MNKLLASFVVLALVSIAQAANPPQTLRIADLTNRPDRWPDQITIRKDMNFGPAGTLKAGQLVKIMQFNGSDVGIDMGHNNLVAIGPEDCDLLEAANKMWAALTPEQRAVDPQMLLNDASLWPDKVKCFQSFTTTTKKEIPNNTEFDFAGYTRDDGIILFSKEFDARLTAPIETTDAVIRSREKAAIDPAKRKSKIIETLRDILIDSDGKPVKLDKLDDTKIFALYYGASWCGPCKAFAPDLIKFVDKAMPANPHLTVLLISGDEKVPDMLGYMKTEKMNFPGVTLADMKKHAMLQGYYRGLIPHLMILDHNGKLLADSYQRGQYVTPKPALAALNKILASGAAK